MSRTASRIGLINTRSLLPKLAELSHWVNNQRPFFLGITEDWLHPDIGDVRQDLQSKVIRSLGGEGLVEQFWVSVSSSRESLVMLGVVYRSPSTTSLVWLDKFAEYASSHYPHLQIVLTTLFMMLFRSMALCNMCCHLRGYQLLRRHVWI
ncbi:unnamed protein product [Dibothriocephalus latus]|uniref:Uncharacterized protein n=1 Tax=Dibothriocephalus latus TaxID=60516 RepID=A0A3P7KXL5_DIBLA|nr:unnamed protein product [Dibothriocephalus latus]